MGRQELGPGWFSLDTLTLSVISQVMEAMNQEIGTMVEGSGFLSGL